MTYERERMRPVSRLIHLMFLNANTAGNDRLRKLLGSMLGAFNRSLHSFTPTHTQHMGTFNFSCNVVNLNQDIVSFFFLYRKFYFPDFPSFLWASLLLLFQIFDIRLQKIPQARCFFVLEWDCTALLIFFFHSVLLWQMLVYLQ